MKKIIFTVKVFLFSIMWLQAQAQPQPIGNLTIFSEDGHRFFLIINGERQNEVAQSNIRVEELLQPYYNVRIIFQDSMLGNIARQNLMIAGPDGIMSDVTYRIGITKSGKPQLNYYSSVPSQQGFIPPAGLYVHRFGQPVVAPDIVVTSTVTSPPVGTISMNAGGVNVTVSAPLYTETTTITNTSTVSGPISERTYNGSSGTGNKVYPMRDPDFIDAKKSIAAANFEDSKLSTAKNIASSNSLSTMQVMEICKMFNFEETKLSFAKYAYRYITDPKNYYKVSGIFTFDTNKVNFNQFLSGNLE
ncbi:DUF4476 domain-containing protein [Niastella caeni]|uniref:DUF4476 domain-containing protein n=1 Tax=Niastella caeni TaxID=2569763 RepID=A0A4S8HWS0_9BACT|nr:DUF4476 domain-containing protein [Niastella caeni]THU40143.1 DUF4476 domain-containing protein [Niastella caeni]